MTLLEECSLSLSFTETARSEIDLAALVETYSMLLFRVAHSVLRSRPEAEDVVQDVFVRVIQHCSTLHEVKEMRLWLVRIAWNLALDRRRRIRPEQIDDAFVQTLISRDVRADVALEESQQMNAVLSEMERLPKAERHVLLLSAVEELRTAEIAEVLGRSECGSGTAVTGTGAAAGAAKRWKEAP